MFKSLEFKHAGQKVKVMDIPVLKEENPFKFTIQVRLQTFITSICAEKPLKNTYSFKDYLKRVLKWPDYEKLFIAGELKNNA